jgi:Flp pilus assembly protein TadD
MKVLAIDPKYVKAYNGLGVSYDRLGDSSSAVQAYQAALALAPQQAYLHNNLGYSYLMQGNPDRAIPAFQKAISLSPRESRFHNNLASAYCQKGLFHLAMEEFRLAGDEARAHFNMAEIYLQKGIYTEARVHYAAALRMNPSYTLAQTGAKAADTLAAILGKSRKQESSQAGAVIPEPPKAEEKKAMEGPAPAAPVREASAHAEKSLPQATETIPVTGRTETSPIIADIPLVQLAAPAADRGDVNVRPLGDDPGRPGKSAQQASLSGSGAIADEWDYEMKAALLSGRAVPILPAGPANATKFAAAKKPETKRDIGIEISNGNGVNQMAKTVGAYLQKKGYPVGRLTNSHPFNYGHTRVYYLEGNGEIALQVAGQLPTYYDLIELKKLDRPSIQVKILLGKDMIPYNKKLREKEGS